MLHFPNSGKVGNSQNSFEFWNGIIFQLPLVKSSWNFLGDFPKCWQVSKFPKCWQVGNFPKSLRILSSHFFFNYSFLHICPKNIFCPFCYPIFEITEVKVRDRQTELPNPDTIYIYRQIFLSVQFATSLLALLTRGSCATR